MTPEDLYNYYKNLSNRLGNCSFETKLEYELMIDLKRTDPKNEIYQIDYKTGKNPLFNVLKAYAHFDWECNYCQGMNFIVSWLLKFLQEPNSSDSSKFIQNEVDAWFLMIHFCIKHQWRDIYRPGMLKVKYHQMFISEVI